MDEDILIKADNISKDFILTHEKSSTLKGTLTNLHKTRDRKEIQHALKNISIEVRRGEFFGIVGRNGSGKSTLLKILAGIYQPTTGSMNIKGRLVPFIELGVGFNAELTGRDNVYLNGALLGFSKQEINKMYNDIVAFAELERFMDQKLKNYSSGMQVRLAFSLAIRAEADILLVDEVLAVGDADFQKKCYRYFRNLKKENKTVVFVSHDMSAIQEYCDRAMLIEKSELVIEGNSYDVAMAYTRMFLEEDPKSYDLKERKKRWGSDDITYTKVKLEPQKIGSNPSVSILTEAIVKKDTKSAVLGFKVRAQDDKELCGTNTKLKKFKLNDLKKGQKINIKWDLPNIFNTGGYYIDVAAQSGDYETIYDWWEEAEFLQVERKEQNSYSILPIIDFECAVE